MAPSNQPPFIKDERVLCFHHELLYEAKVLDSRLSDSNDKKSSLQYRVHYKGWKNTWDDWVPQDRLRKLTDENKALAQELKRELDASNRRAVPTKATHASAKKKAAGSDLSSTRGSEERQSSVPATGRGQKRGRDFDLEKVRNPHFTFTFSIPHSTIPINLHHKPSDIITASSLPNIHLQAFTSSALFAMNLINSFRRHQYQTLPQDENEIAGPSKQRDLPDASEILSKSPPVDSRRKAMLRDVTETTTIAQHPQLAKLNFEDAGNEAKRQFFKAQDPNDTLMLAGYTAESSIHPLHSPTHNPHPNTTPNPPTIHNDHPNETNNTNNAHTPLAQEEPFTTRPAIRLHIPDHLKALLVDDWENVTKNLQLVPLPSKTPANAILTAYYDDEQPKRRPGSADADILEEVVAGVKEYFDKCLGRILLYRFEREQFFEIRLLWEGGRDEWDGKGPGDVYGAEHLCRLFVSMPELIAQTNMDQQSVNRLREELIKMTTWLGKNSNRYFTAEYENASQEYIEKARGV